VVLFALGRVHQFTALRLIGKLTYSCFIPDFIFLSRLYLFLAGCVG